MKQTKLTMLSLALILFGCQQAELIDPNENGGQEMKTVTISAGRDLTDTKASLDSESGAFTWQSGDVISVLATDGKFYDFTLTTGNGEREAVFEGTIPQPEAVTTVATYPATVENGAANTILAGNTLNYILPTAWTHAADVSNVPMVATFGENAEHMSFKQIGGVMRFPVKNLPTEAEFVITMNDKTITGPFPVDISTLGESTITAGQTASVLTISYSSEKDGTDTEFNVPVPVGTYNNFKVEIKDADGNVLLAKEYSQANEVKRTTLLNMQELVLPERQMVVSEVWPFFVDARVVFGKHEGVTKYAFYIDDSDSPVIIEAEDLGDMQAALIGGQFAHNSTHTVAVAKVVDDQPLTEYKSEPVSFTTGRVMQMTYNTGTKFICAGWDDVAIGKENSTVYDEVTKKWSLVKVSDVNGRNVRGYRVELYDENMNVLYKEVPFSGQVDYGGAISSSSWVGKIGNANVLLPTALSFGWLEPGKKYYFRVQTLAEPVVFNSPETDYFKPDGAGVTLTSPRGGCGWSEYVEMTTDEEHVPSENEVLFESFDDMMYNSDIMNIAPAAVPQFLTATTKDSDYKSRKSADLYKEWVKKPFSERKFSEQGFNTMLGAYYLGLTDDSYSDSSTPRYLNEYAGSLEGWSIVSAGSNERTVNPNFGSVRLGQSGTNAGKIALRTAPIMSDKLSETTPKKCIIRVKVSAHATTQQNVNAVLGVYHYRGDKTLDDKNTIQFNIDKDHNILPDWSENYTWTDVENYTHYPRWFEATTELNLLKGDVIGFEKANPKVDGVSDFYKGCVTIGEITIEVAPTENEFADDGIGTEPDDTDYDIFNLGEFPISYWYTVEPSSYYKIDGATGQGYYDHDLTKARYQEVKDAGMNIALYYGHSIDRSITENKRLHDICKEVGLKFIGNTWAADNATRIQQIKDAFKDSETYVGELLRDEPSVLEFDDLGAFVKEYNTALPDKEVYINLFPEYANAAAQLKTDYENYINQYLEKVPTKSLSYDYYGLHKSGGIFTDFYSNLDLVRYKTLSEKTPKPFWVITQAGIAGSGRMPNEVSERWSVWANIALGSKGISYFCYWTPSGGTYNDNGFMIDINGNKTDMYTWVQKINKDINTIGKKLLHCHADGAIMTSTTYYPLYVNNGSGRSKYGPVSNVSGNQSVLCGCFRDARKSENGENFRGYKNLVMSEMPERDVIAYLNIDNSVTAITFTHNNVSQKIELSNTLSTCVGNILIAFDGAQLTLNIPSGEAVLLEF